MGEKTREIIEEINRHFTLNRDRKIEGEKSAEKKG